MMTNSAYFLKVNLLVKTVTIGFLMFKPNLT